MAGLFDGGHGKDDAAKAARRDEVRKFLWPDQREVLAKVQALSI
jgi:hypothetical protein